MTQLSPNFSYAEFTKTSQPIANVPDATQLANLRKTAVMLEQVRALLGHPITVNSAFRSVAVNKAVGGVATSDHCLGCAVDFVCPAFGTPYQIAKAIEASDIAFGQMIAEGTWLHLSWKPNPRRLLTLKAGHYVPGIVR